MYKTSFHFFSKLKNVSREQLLSFIETAVNLHPHLRELLPSDAAAAAAGPPAPPVPPPDATLLGVIAVDVGRCPGQRSNCVVGGEQASASCKQHITN